MRPLPDGSSVSPSRLQEPDIHARHPCPSCPAGPAAQLARGHNRSHAPVGGFHRLGRRARNRRDRRCRRAGDRSGRQHLHLAEGRGPQLADAAVAERSAARRSVPRLLQSAGSAGRAGTAWTAPRQFARLGLRHRSLRPRRHQQPRDLGSRRGDRHSQRRRAAQGRGDRQGSEDRHRPAAGQERSSRSRR